MDWRPWMDAFLPPLLEALPGRVAFVGIQGSFGRGEAGPESDVDLVGVLDALGAAELAACRGVLEKMPSADRARGFFCDRAALAAWRAFDALQLRLDTLPVYGSLEELLPPMGKETLDEAVRAAASALYHAACHTALFDAQPEAALPALQKAAFFALRLAHCRRSGQYTAARQSLLPKLEPEERARIKGLVINKFRGDVKILEPGLRMIEERLRIPVVGVIPMEQIDLDDEDSLSDRLVRTKAQDGLDVAVIHLPHISNFTDFNALEHYDGVSLRYVDRPAHLGQPDLILLPGTKNTMADLKWLRESGLEAMIWRLVEEQKVPVIGICGGYQMLGEQLSDPHGVEGEPGSTMRGMGLLAAETIFAAEKTRTRTEGMVMAAAGVYGQVTGQSVKGYEIHMGETFPAEAGSGLNGSQQAGAGQQPGNASRADHSVTPAICLADGRMDGFVRADGLVFGSYLHGLFDNLEFTGAILTRLAEKKGISLTAKAQSMEEYKESQYDKLADLVRRSLDMEAVYKIMEEYES